MFLNLKFNFSNEALEKTLSKILVSKKSINLIKNIAKSRINKRP